MQLSASNEIRKKSKAQVFDRIDRTSAFELNSLFGLRVSLIKSVE